jgi:hypothetical protein
MATRERPTFLRRNTMAKLCAAKERDERLGQLVPMRRQIPNDSEAGDEHVVHHDRNPQTGFTSRRTNAYTACTANKTSTAGHTQSIVTTARPVMTVDVASVNSSPGTEQQRRETGDGLERSWRSVVLSDTTGQHDIPDDDDHRQREVRWRQKRSHPRPRVSLVTLRADSRRANTSRPCENRATQGRRRRTAGSDARESREARCARPASRARPRYRRHSACARRGRRSCQSPPHSRQR